MEKERRRWRCLSLTVAGMECSGRAGVTCTHVPTSISDFADELLKLVLLRVGSHLCLVRAAVVCKQWRRVVAAADFLRRYRSLHAPPVLGHYYAGANATFVPSPPPPGEAAAIEISDRLSLNFFPDSKYHFRNLVLTDRSGSLLAFICSDFSIEICNPWTRQLREVRPPTMGESYWSCLGAFLLIADEIGTTPDMSNFRALYALASSLTTTAPQLSEHPCSRQVRAAGSY